MLSIDERNSSRDLWAFVAYDTIDVLIARVENLARSSRRMTKIRSNPSQPTTFPDVKTGLTVDNSHDNGIRIWDRPTLGGAGISVLCTPGIESWGVSAYQHDGNEARVRTRFQSELSPSTATSIFISGGQTNDSKDAGRDDRIDILEYNDYGVATMTTITFDLVPSKERAEHDAQTLDALAAGRDTWTADELTDLARDLRDNWSTIPEELSAPGGAGSVTPATQRLT